MGEIGAVVSHQNIGKSTILEATVDSFNKNEAKSTSKIDEVSKVIDNIETYGLLLRMKTRLFYYGMNFPKSYENFKDEIVYSSE